MRFHPNSIGLGISGDYLAGLPNLATTGQVWYVDSASGADDVSPRGLSPEYPLATLDQAVTNSATGDIVVLKSTHDETLTAQITMTKRLTIVGLGSSSGVPLACLTNNVAGNNMLEYSSAPWEIRNVRFKEDGASATLAKLKLGTDCKVDGCLFEVGDDDPQAYAAVEMGTSSAIHIVDSTFRSVGTDATTPPGPLITSLVVTDTLIQRCTFSAGITGFYGNSGYGVYLNATMVNLVLEDLTLQGCDIYVASASTGRYNVVSSTGSARVEW